MEIKRQIIESKTPPSNKEVWWFDVNDETIKRYKQGKWIAILAQESDENKPTHAIVKYSTTDGLPVVSESAILNSTLEVIFPTTSIPSSAFIDKTTLYQVVIADATKIEYLAFCNCTSLTSVTIPDSVTSIEDSTFSGCTSLKSVTIGNSITSIGKWAFNGCNWMKTIYCKSITPPTLDSSSIPGTIDVIYVPLKSLDAYKDATNWSEYRDKIVGYNF